MTLIYPLQKKIKISRLPNVTFTYIHCSREVYILILYEIHLFPSVFDHIYTVRRYTIFIITLIYPKYMKTKLKIIGLLKYCWCPNCEEMVKKNEIRFITHKIQIYTSLKKDIYLKVQFGSRINFFFIYLDISGLF